MRRSNLRAAVSVALSALVVAAAGCAQVIGIEDTELAPIEPGRDLTCVGKVSTPEGDGSEVEIYARIVDITDPTKPVEGMRVVPCASRLQQDCDTSTTYFSDENGEVRVPVLSGYNGYLRIEDPTGDVSPTGWITYFWYFSEPIVETRETPFPISAMRRGFRQRVMLVVSARTHADVYGLGMLAWWRARHRKFDYRITLTREQRDGCLAGHV